MDRIAVPEMLIVFPFFLLSLLPIVLAAWALFMLLRVRAAQDDICRRLENIERLLQRTAG